MSSQGHVGRRHNVHVVVVSHERRSCRWRWWPHTMHKLMAVVLVWRWTPELLQTMHWRLCRETQLLRRRRRPGFSRIRFHNCGPRKHSQTSTRRIGRRRGAHKVGLLSHTEIERRGRVIVLLSLPFLRRPEVRSTFTQSLGRFFACLCVSHIPVEWNGLRYYHSFS
jgi:hypothetical protein